MKSSKLLLAVVGATALMGVLTSTTSARTLSFSSQTLRASFRSVEFIGVFGTTRCLLTLEGSLHSRTVAKVAGSLIGFITAARLGACTAGTATILTATLPWHDQYRSFAEALPVIERITTNLIGVSVAVREPGGFVCLVRSTAAEPVAAVYHLSGGTITSEVASGTITTGDCLGQASFVTDAGVVTVLNSATTVTVRLI